MNMRAVIKAKRAIVTSHPPGISSLMLDGQSTDGRANHARKETSPSHGEAMPADANGVCARPNAVSQMIPTVR